ncbi:zinc finger protein 774-like [Diaphorina citri]|uniref:Zinc finger protein 774-like n=1 Tax=Diaphorina citri TaxID=121845 RepID=A0A3Q0JR09_DIACI|nr:zinc finger protein 774-like [Diaphorina citri]
MNLTYRSPLCWFSEKCIHCGEYTDRNLIDLAEHCRSCIAAPRPHPFRYRFVCYACNKNFYQISDIKRHIATHFKRKPVHVHSLQYTCIHCVSFSSDNVNLLIQHGKKCAAVVRPDPQKFKFVCFACNYFTYQRGNIVNHTRRHLGEKPFKCHCFACNYFTYQRGNIVNHTRRHLGEKPFKCPLCLYRSRQKIHLQTHMKRHYN